MQLQVLLHTQEHIYSVHTCTCRYNFVHSAIAVYMLGTDVKPQARFKAVRTVVKPSGPL